ncbi:hypothetical protein [Helicobacter vulpis]|uniref:hypothetical protein n=1 Tax=Helicobacter vulpis TaxID=2316076 RepID=UPI000EB4D1F5|nr:hypothetical protein [Helicobacter vulpis]
MAMTPEQKEAQEKIDKFVKENPRAAMGLGAGALLAMLGPVGAAVGAGVAIAGVVANAKAKNKQDS